MHLIKIPLKIVGYKEKIFCDGIVMKIKLFSRSKGVFSISLIKRFSILKN
jgi:hypothetical protein